LLILNGWTPGDESRLLILNGWTPGDESRLLILNGWTLGDESRLLILNGWTPGDESRLLILNGWTPGDESREFTCLANGGCSTIDYIVGSPIVWQAATHLEVIIDDTCYCAMGGRF
jgi:hypothetical protein